MCVNRKTFLSHTHTRTHITPRAIEPFFGNDRKMTLVRFVGLFILMTLNNKKRLKYTKEHSILMTHRQHRSMFVLVLVRLTQEQKNFLLFLRFFYYFHFEWHFSI